ncbi:MAG: GWxTD domain-containing protein [bacterium]|nr:GWxTD domain-containing protein [bacterium]
MNLKALVEIFVGRNLLLFAVLVLPVLALVLSCSPDTFELNRAMYDGVPYVRRYIHPAFPRPDSTRSDTLLTRLRETWNDLESILPESEEESLYGIEDVTHLEWWIEEFWRVRDPDPTTKLNEYRVQHFERLAYARDIYESPAPPYYDDRGWAVLRYGMPDQVIAAGPVIGGGYEPPIEVWKIDDMLFAFQSFINNDVFSRCGMPDGRTWIFHALAGNRRQALMMLENFEIVEEQDRILSEYEPDMGQLWVAASVDCYRAPREGGEDRTLLRIYYQLRDNELEMADRLGVGGKESVIKQAVALVDPESREYRAGDDSEKRFPRSKYDTKLVYLSGVLEQVVAAGEYDLTLHIEDAVSGKTGLYGRHLDVRSFPPDILALSDISLYNCNIPDEGGFDQETNPRIPHPMASYLSRMIPGFYFEIYGLQATALGKRKYSLSYSIRQNGKYIVSSYFVEDTLDETVRTNLVIDTAQLGPGAYVMEITVTDLVARPWDFTANESQVVGKRQFRIVDPNEQLPADRN